jgi:hypothetical protein
MKTYTDRVIESYNKGSTYTCNACFKEWQGRYVGTEFVNDGVMRFCGDDCKAWFKGAH